MIPNIYQLSEDWVTTHRIAETISTPSGLVAEVRRAYEAGYRQGVDDARRVALEGLAKVIKAG